MRTKLQWKKKWLDDKSGYWYSSKIPVIGWEYVVEDCGYGFWEVGLYLSKTDTDVTQVVNKDYKNEKAAMRACEKHFINTSKKFIKWLTNK